MRQAIRPFAFACDFQDSRAQARSPLELEAEIAALRLEVAAAREAGREEGMEQALAVLRAERESAWLAAAEALVTALGRVEERFAETEQAVARLGAELALDMADHLAGRALERDPVSSIDAALGRALRQVRRGQPLQLRVAPGIEEAVQQCLDERQAGERRRLSVTVIADPAVPPGDARIQWDGGSLLLDRDARAQAMAGEIAALFAA